MSNRPNPNRNKAATKAVRAAPATPESKPFWQSPLLWVITFVLIVAVATGVLAVNNSDTPAARQETGFAEVIGTPLARFADPDTAIGATAPSIVASTFDGDRVQFGSDGVARIYAFVAHWCSHCQREVPKLVAWMDGTEVPDGVDVVVISTAVSATADNYPPSAWLEREGWTGTTVVDSEEGDVALGYGLAAFPFWVAVDANDTVIFRATGEVTEATFRSLLDQAAASVGTDSAGAEEDAADAPAGLRTVLADDAAALLADPPDDLVILDVRTPEEHADGHIADSQLIDFYEPDFSDRLADLDPTVPYVIYCRSGNRSGQTLTIMRELGFEDVTEVDGGIVQWQAGGHPLQN
jgi:rhodanese-related sulfurtransferase/thiol-disulfide isomerase/thioredoxin